MYLNYIAVHWRLTLSNSKFESSSSAQISVSLMMCQVGVCLCLGMRYEKRVLLNLRTMYSSGELALRGVQKLKSFDKIENLYTSFQVWSGAW